MKPTRLPKRKTKRIEKRKSITRKILYKKKKKYSGGNAAVAGIGAATVAGLSLGLAARKKCCPIEKWIDKSHEHSQKIKEKKRKALTKKFTKAAQNLGLSREGRKILMQELYNRYPKIFPDLVEDKIKKRRNEKRKKKKNTLKEQKNIFAKKTMKKIP